MYPIEIISSISQFAHGRTYESLLSTCKTMRNDLQKYTSYAYPMDREQRNAYNDLCETKENYIRFVTLPHTGGSLVLLNYIYIYLKKNPTEKVSILCEKSKKYKWNRILFNTFDTSSFSSEKATSSSIYRFIIRGSAYENKEANLIIASCRFYENKWKQDDPSLQFIISSHSYRRTENMKNVSEVFKRSIVPFSLTKSRCIKCGEKEEFSSILTRILSLHDKITILGGSSHLSNSSWKVFDEKSASEFRRYEGKAILVYTVSYLRSHTPNLSGIVLVRCESASMPRYANNFDCIKSVDSSLWNALFMSKNIECIYYMYVEMYYSFQIEYGPFSPREAYTNREEFFAKLFKIEMNFRLETLGETASTKNTSFCRYMERYPNLDLDSTLKIMDDPIVIMEWYSREYFARLYERFKKHYPLNSSLVHLLL